MKRIAEYGSRQYVRNLERYLRQKTALIARLVEALEQVHPKTSHLGWGLIGKAENGANLWGPIDYGIGCDICDLIKKTKGEA
jgi:hypothetical protein